MQASERYGARSGDWWVVLAPRLAVLLVVFVLVVAAIATLTAEPALGSGTVLEVADGAVFVRHAGAEDAASAGQVVVPGDEIRTGDGGHAVVAFFDGSTVTLEPATTLRGRGRAS